jgi:hypothetical protein
MEKGVQLVLVQGEDKSSVSKNADRIVCQWLERFEAALAKEPLDLEGLFVEDSWLKDAVVLSWNLRTLQGISKITHYIHEQKARNKLFNLKVSRRPSLQPVLKEMGPTVWLESGFDFETEVGQGRGVLRLANTALGEWKAWIVFLRLEELKGHPQEKGLNRARFRQPLSSVPEGTGDKTEPAVVIIGGGMFSQNLYGMSHV